MMLEFSNFLLVFGLMMVVMNSMSRVARSPVANTRKSKGARAHQRLGGSIHRVHLRLGPGPVRDDRKWISEPFGEIR